MKQTAQEYVILTGLCLATTIYILSREYSRPLPVHATERETPIPAAPTVKAEIAVEVTFSLRERQLLREYVRARSETNKPGKPLPPGLARKADRGKHLPPGWQEKLVPGEILSDQVYRECHNLPREILLRLPPQPLGTKLIAIDGKVIRLTRSDREILDILDLQPSGI